MIIVDARQLGTSGYDGACSWWNSSSHDSSLQVWHFLILSD